MRYVHARTGAEHDARDDFAERRSDRWRPVVAGGPSTSAVKAVWVDHAVAQGMDRSEAESATKADLMARFGS